MFIATIDVHRAAQVIGRGAQPRVRSRAPANAPLFFSRSVFRNQLLPDRLCDSSPVRALGLGNRPNHLM
jgi:hypothetical protein